MPQRGKSMRKRTETVPKRRKKRGPVWDPRQGRDGQGDLLELAVVQLGVEAPLLEELVVGAALHNVPLPQDQDEVCVLDGGQAVGDDEGRCGAP